jgi:hypothetical protein
VSWRSTAVIALVGVLGACGRSEVVLREEALRCRPDPAGPGAGCTFLVGPGLHLVGAIESLSTVPERREPDGVFVVNPHPADTLTLRISQIYPDDDEPWPRDLVELGPGRLHVLSVPNAGDSGLTGQRRGGRFLLEGSHPFGATSHRPRRSFEGNDSELLLPVEALGQLYVVASYPPLAAQFQGAGEPSFFEVVARWDGTTVRWRPRQDTAGDGAAIDPVRSGEWSPMVVLDRYESLRVVGIASPTDPWQGDVSGTVVEASAPVAVTAGSRCASVPPSTNALAGCDPLVEQLIPVVQWGREVAVPHPPLRGLESHYLRIYAGADEVALTTEPRVASVPASLRERGEFVDVVVSNGTSFVVEADGPIMVVAYLGSRDPRLEIGDPAMYQLVPTERFLSRYVVATGTQWATHLLQAVRFAGAAEVTVDGQPLAGWERFAGFETAVVEVSEGSHVVASEEAFGLTQLGWTNGVHDACTPFGHGGECHTSYAHPAGLRLR